jgi:hypothetical protein
MRQKLSAFIGLRVDRVPVAYQRVEILEEVMDIDARLVCNMDLFQGIPHTVQFRIVRQSRITGLPDVPKL